MEQEPKHLHHDSTIHGPPQPDLGGPGPALPSQPSRGRIGILRPLRHRDFAWLWSGMTISLLGDGIYLVAIAFQVYALSNSPTALSVVFFAWTAPMVLCFLLSGVLTDRFDRRFLMIAADVMRGGSVLVMGFMSLAGELTIGHMLWLVAIYGVGDAFFMPAFTAIVPDIVPKDLLLEANSLDQFVRPLTMRFMGPAIGGLLIGVWGPGGALLFNGASFAVSVVCVLMIRARPRPKKNEETSALKDIKEGMHFVRSRTWLWGTLASASVGLLFFIGPLEVLVPYVVKNDLGGDAGDYGLVLSAGGVGALLVSFVMGQRGLPKRHILFMYSTWGIGVLIIASFAVVGAVWQALISSLFMSAMFTAGMIVWGTLMHRLVPTELLGRVSSLDWLVSTALIPVSFIATGPVAERIGVDTTLLLAGIIGSALTFVFLLLPGIRDTEQDGTFNDPEIEAEDPRRETELVSA